MKEILFNLAKALFPTPDSDEPMHIFRWRQTLALTTVSMGALIMVHVAWACGWLLAIGLPGFALEQNVDDLKAQYTDFRGGQLEQQILDAKRGACIAAMQGNQAGLDYQNYVLNLKTNEYYRVTGRVFQMPSCDQLVVQAPVR